MAADDRHAPAATEQDHQHQGTHDARRRSSGYTRVHDYDLTSALAETWTEVWGTKSAR